MGGMGKRLRERKGGGRKERKTKRKGENKGKNERELEEQLRHRLKRTRWVLGCFRNKRKKVRKP